MTEGLLVFMVSGLVPPGIRVWLDGMTDRHIASALGFGRDEVDMIHFANLEVGGRNDLIAVVRRDCLDFDDDPPTAVSFDAFGVPVVEARGDFLVLRRTGVRPGDIGPLTEEDVAFLCEYFTEVPCLPGCAPVKALIVGWLA